MELSREEVERRLAAVGYVADPQLAMAIMLMRTLGRPLLLEGEAGVGKTEVGKALARMLGRPLIRLQCYEGLDTNTALYEWNYQRQLLKEYAAMADEFGFRVIEGRRSVTAIQEELRRQIGAFLEESAPVPVTGA